MIDRIGAAAAAMGSGMLIPLIALGALLPFTLMPITITITPDEVRRKREAGSPANDSFGFDGDSLGRDAPDDWQERVQLALQHIEVRLSIVLYSEGIV